MFCQSVMYFHTPANSLKFTPPLFSLSNMAEREREGGVKDRSLTSHTVFTLCLPHIHTSLVIEVGTNPVCDMKASMV